MVSDSLIVVDNDSGKCLRYDSPLGFRRRNLYKNSQVLEKCESLFTVSQDTGLVALTRPEDYFGIKNSEGGKIDNIYILHEVNKTREVHVQSLKTHSIPFYPKKLPLEFLPEECYVVSFDCNASNKEKAKRIHELS